jgi:hypothetical protein
MLPDHTIGDVSKTTVYDQPAVEKLDQVKHCENAHPMTTLGFKQTSDAAELPGAFSRQLTN